MPLARVPGRSGPLPGLVLLAVAILPGPAVDRRPQDPELVSGEPVVIELDGTERAVLVRAELEGRCHVWASSEALDPRLRLLSESGDELAVDEDGGGGTTAFLDFPVGPGASFVVLVEAQDGGGGRVVVQRADGLETPASIAVSQRARAALASARQLLGEGRGAEACARIDAARSELEAVLNEVDSLAAAAELWQLGVLAGQAEDIRLVEACLEPVLALRERTLPPGHLERFTARFNVDWLIHMSGDSRRARERFVATLEECRRMRGEQDLLVARMAIALSFLHWRVGRGDLAWDLLGPAERRLAEALPEDDVDRVWAALQRARLLADRGDHRASLELYEHLAGLTDPARGPGNPNRGWILIGWADVLRELGQLRRARELSEAVLEQRRRSLPPGHPDVLWAEIGLAAVLSDQGHHQEALALKEHVVGVRERFLAPDHIDLLDAQAALAATYFQMGDLQRARALQETVLANLPPDLPPDNRTRLRAQTNLSLTFAALGEPQRAVALTKGALAILERTREPDDPELRCARQNASIALFACGELERSRTLAERALAAAERTLGEDHIDLLSARANMASVLHGLGDYASQRDLLEQVVEAASRVLPADSLDLARYRIQLSHAWRHLDELERALDLLLQVLDTVRARYGERSSVALHALSELGQIYWRTSRFEELVPMLEEELELRRGGRGDSRDTQNARARMAFVLAATGQNVRAEALLTDVLAERESDLPEGSPLIRDPLLGLAGLAAGDGRGERASELCLRMVDSAVQDLRTSVLVLSPQESELYALDQERYVSTCMSLVRLHGEAPWARTLRERLFTLVESLRGIGMTEARLLGQAAADPRLDELRNRVRRTSLDLITFAQGEGGRDQMADARLARDGALRELLAHLRSTSAAQELLEPPTPRALANRLGSGAAAVGYLGYTWRGKERGSWVLGGERHLAAHVLLPDGTLELVDLGPRAEIDEAVSAWRDALRAPRERGVGVGLEDPEQSQRARGDALRRLVFDPLRPYLGDARRLVVALDDVLHSVPLDALPDGEGLLGDSFTFVVRATLRELAWPPREPPAGGLVALGGASFNSQPTEGGKAPEDGGTRSSAWDRGFAPLPYTASEVQGIAALYAEVLEPRTPARLLLGREATRDGIVQAAPGARWLHLATHGWFSPESVRGIEEALAVDAALGIEIGVSREERIRASSPMVLCGLALAGANLPADEFGRLPGVLTAEEVATWDLSTCDLAVLSACDTNVGVQRSGQGVASLQKALHMAGARSVVTSLWKVPDEATQELMLEFYRRLWALGEPKATALWRAKQKLRQARDPQGRPRYSNRDWAAWVLTGDPD